MSRRLVKATCIYDKRTYQIYNLTAHHKTNNITLVEYPLDSPTKPYKYSTFGELYQTCLSTLRQNGMYVKTWVDFNAVWFDINFIDLNYPTEIHHYALSRA